MHPSQPHQHDHIHTTGQLLPKTHRMIENSKQAILQRWLPDRYTPKMRPAPQQQKTPKSIRDVTCKLAPDKRLPPPPTL